MEVPGEGSRLAGVADNCRACNEDASETKKNLKKEIDALKAKFAFIKISYPPGNESPTSCFTDVLLLASDDADSVPVPAHKAVLASRSAVFRAMLETGMEEIMISDVSQNALVAFASYLYTAEACLDEQMASDLLGLAEKYQVECLKSDCEEFLLSNLTGENAIGNYFCARQHNAKKLADSALALIVDKMNMDKLKLHKHKDYDELAKKDPKGMVKIFEAHLDTVQEP